MEISLNSKALFIPGVNIAAVLRAGLFLFRIAKAAKLAPRIAKGLQNIFSSGRQAAHAFLNVKIRIDNAIS